MDGASRSRVFNNVNRIDSANMCTSIQSNSLRTPIHNFQDNYYSYPSDGKMVFSAGCKIRKVRAAFVGDEETCCFNPSVNVCCCLAYVLVLTATGKRRHQ